MATAHRNPNLRKQHLDILIKMCDGRVCQGCYWYFDDLEDLEVDHIAPKSDGGSDALDNLTLLCSRCNRLKGNRLTLTSLRNELKNNPDSMPQTPGLKTTVYVIADTKFEARVKPTKALRDLLDDVSSHAEIAGRQTGYEKALKDVEARLQNLRSGPVYPPPPPPDQWTPITERKYKTKAKRPSEIRFGSNNPIPLKSWRAIWRLTALWLVDEGLINSDEPVVEIEWKQGKLDVIRFDRPGRELADFTELTNGFYVRQHNTWSETQWTYRLLDHLNVDPGVVLAKFD